MNIAAYRQVMLFILQMQKTNYKAIMCLPWSKEAKLLFSNSKQLFSKKKIYFETVNSYFQIKFFILIQKTTIFKMKFYFQKEFLFSNRKPLFSKTNIFKQKTAIFKKYLFSNKRLLFS